MNTKKHVNHFRIGDWIWNVFDIEFCWLNGSTGIMSDYCKFPTEREELKRILFNSQFLISIEQIMKLSSQWRQACIANAFDSRQWPNRWQIIAKHIWSRPMTTKRNDPMRSIENVGKTVIQFRVLVIGMKHGPRVIAQFASVSAWNIKLEFMNCVQWFGRSWNQRKKTTPARANRNGTEEKKRNIYEWVEKKGM